MKLSLLEIVQDILSDISSDEVNSISDTVESLQIAQLVKSTYYNIVSEFELPSHKRLIQLTPSGDADKPTHMSVPTNVDKLEWVKYNIDDTGNKPVYRTITFMYPEQFIDYISNRDLTENYIDQVTDYSGNPLLIRNDTPPTYYTSFDDEHIVFDSYNRNVDTTLQNSKTICYGEERPTFTLSDSYIPDLPANLHPYLLSEAKSRVFFSIKQMGNEKEEQIARRHRIRAQRSKWKTQEYHNLPDYGRK